MGVNLECVNPQLSNNPELAYLLERFETTWEKSKMYLTSQNDIKNIVNFYKIIQTARNKSRKFELALETFDSTIFFTIPNILVLYSAFDLDMGLFRNK